MLVRRYKQPIPLERVPPHWQPTVIALQFMGYELLRLPEPYADYDVYRVADAELIAWWEEGDWDSLSVMRLENCPGAQLLRATMEGQP